MTWTSRKQNQIFVILIVQAKRVLNRD